MMLLFLVIVSIVALLFLGMMAVMVVVAIGDYLTYRELQKKMKADRSQAMRNDREDEGV